MDSINKLIEQFRQFPGIGPRQAKRFVYFLLAQPESYRSSLMKSVGELDRYIRICEECQRFFPIGEKFSGKIPLCSICADPNRSNESLLIVSRDVDLENIEKSHSYVGKYFVLGGLIPILEKDPGSRIRMKELQSLIEKRSTLNEVVFALNLTPEGENTEEYLRSVLAPLLEKIEKISQENPGKNGGVRISLSSLGRGLSTGLELEYSDSETIKNALKNRG